MLVVRKHVFHTRENWSLPCLTLGVISIPTMAAKEGELIRNILDGRRDLFGDLITPHLTPLRRTVRATIGGHPEVEDIVQQTALKAFIHLDQFRCEARFSTWLIRIGLNEARAWRRKCGSSRLLAPDVPTLTQLPVADQRHSPLVEFQRSEASVRLHTALAWLPEKYRIVILLRDLEDLRISEVAQRLGLTIPAVKTRHMRARQKMAKFLRPLRQSRPPSARLPMIGLGDTTPAPQGNRFRMQQIVRRAWGRVRWKMMAIVTFTGASAILIACLAAGGFERRGAARKFQYRGEADSVARSGQPVRCSRNPGSCRRLHGDTTEFRLASSRCWRTRMRCFPKLRPL